MNEKLTKIKEKWSTIQFNVADLFFYFLHFNVPGNKCHKKQWRVPFFTRIKLVVRVPACARAIAHIKRRRLNPWGFRHSFSNWCLWNMERIKLIDKWFLNVPREQITCINTGFAFSGILESFLLTSKTSPKILYLF